MVRKNIIFKLCMSLIVIVFIISGQVISAQTMVISGTITDQSGLPLPGVNILIKNTTVGTTSDGSGKYIISAESGAVLVFSFIGYVTQEISAGERNSIDVVLITDIEQLGDVFVTALGIKRSAKALQSAIDKVPGVNISQAMENNVGSTLQGRVAGVDVSNAHTGPAGSTRVLIRGNKSIAGNNQPLYVVDGIPMDNRFFGQVGTWGGTDQGDGLTSINAEDIESVSILKGVSAAALYGSRGGFGVINIVTKKGAARKGIGVEYFSSYSLETLNNLSDLQHVFGPGGLANADPGDYMSPRVYSKASNQYQAWNWGAGSMWGPKLDGSQVVQFDGVERPYSYAGDNWKRFYDTGRTWINEISLSGGNDKQNFRFSFSDLNNKYIIPNSGFRRRNASFFLSGKFGKKVTFDAKAMYSNEQMKNRAFLADSPGNAVQSVWNLASTVNIEDLKGDPGKWGAVPPGVTTPDLKSAGEEYQQANNAYLQNPWWCAYQYANHTIRDRIITSAELKYDILTWLYVRGRIGMDWFTRNNDNLVPQGTGYYRIGSKSETSDFVREINMEWMLGADRELGRFRINAFLGGNKMVNESEKIGADGNKFNIPFFSSITNTQNQTLNYGYSKYGINSLFGSAELSFNNYLFVTATARNDWFSVLNPQFNSQFYPSVGASFIVTDVFKRLREYIDYLKIRASWGEVATTNLGPYSTNLAYYIAGRGHLGVPMGQIDVAIPNPSLSPALSGEVELGAEIRIINSRLGLGFTYYNQRTKDEILTAGISNFSGFAYTMLNIGKLSNKGFEMILTGTPVLRPLRWDISLNMSVNKNRVDKLGGTENEFSIGVPRTRTVSVKILEGYPYGMITGFVQKKDSMGRKVYKGNGMPLKSDGYEILGNGVADVTGGLINSIGWKQLRLEILTDFKFGAEIYSGTNVRLTQWGMHKQTLRDREEGLLIEGVTQTGNNPDGSPIYEPLSVSLDQEQTYNYWQNLGNNCQENFVYDASFIKLRQVLLEYSLPAKLLNKTPFRNLSISISGRNLANLYKKTENIDPESSYSSGGGQGLDYFGMPATRSFIFNLRVTF